MIVKLLLNILINVGIFGLLLGLIWAFNHEQYPIMGGGIFLLALLVFLKIRMIKSIRQLAKKP